MARRSRARSRTSAMAKAVRQEVLDLYQELEIRITKLERRCLTRTRCCRFRLTGEVPQLTRGEALLAAAGVRASGRKALPEDPEGACPLLDREGRCRIYEHRPFGCRSHFCGPAGGKVPRRDIQDLIQRLESLDERLGGVGPRPLPAAVASVLSEW